MRQLNYYLFCALFLFYSFSAFAQQENIQTEHHYTETQFSPSIPYAAEVTQPDESTASQPASSMKDMQNQRVNETYHWLPSKGKIRLLCILIEYPDLIHTVEKEQFETFFNGEGDKYPSVKEYFKEVSYGKMDLQVDVVGWYQARKSYSYYQYRYSELTKEALQAAAPSIDLSLYDHNGDGVVEGIMFVHSGPGAEEEGGNNQYIYSHSSSMYKYQVNQHKVAQYSVLPETRQNKNYGHDGMAGIGMYCHQIGHLMGLPDLRHSDFWVYDYGVSSWGLMGNGSWSGNENFPSPPSAWSKEKLEWVVVKDITKQYGDYELLPASTQDTIYRINTFYEKEYFLLENRGAVGFDQSITGYGLAIWHINKNKTDLYPPTNEINHDPNRKGLDLEEANNQDANKSAFANIDQLYPFGSADKFDFSTSPNSNIDSDIGKSKITGIEIKDITRLDNNRIRFSYKNKTDNNGADCTTPLTATDGVNQAENGQWFVYTIPEDGPVYVSTVKNQYHDEARVDYTGNCNVSTEWVSQYTDSPSEQKLLEFGKKGEKLYLKWTITYDPTSQPHIIEWNIRTAKGNVENSDSLALVAMHKSMNGKEWVSASGWLEKPLAEWEGVTLQQGRVTGLEIEGMKGKLPEDFYTLTALEHLTLINISSSNLETGVLDTRIAQMKNLRIININWADITLDVLSALPQLTALEHVSLYGKKNLGELPADISKLTRLKGLHITSVKTTLPKGLGSLPELEALSVPGATGTIPAELADAPMLAHIDLPGGGLEGEIPASLGKNKKLHFLNLSNNQLTGAVPASIFESPVLNAVYLGNNQLETLPDNIFQASKVQSYHFSYNKIKELPDFKVNPNHELIHFFSLDNNQITEIPASLGKHSFDYLNLSNNKIKSLPALTFNTQINISHNSITEIAEIKTISTDDPVNESFVFFSHNKLSFSQIKKLEPFMDRCGECAYNGLDYYYFMRPQDSVDVNLEVKAKTGEKVTLQLPVDDEVKNSTYFWFKDNKALDTTEVNSLTFESITAEDAGTYHCEIINEAYPAFRADEIFPEMRLYYVGFRVEVEQAAQIAQKLTIALPDKIVFTDGSFTIAASSDAKLPLQMEVVDGEEAISLQDNKATILKVGKTAVRIFNDGNEAYLPADTLLDITIEKGQQQISLQEIPDQLRHPDEEPVQLTYYATSELPVKIEALTDNIEIRDSTVVVIGSGEAKIRATQPGNENYEAAQPVEISFNIDKSSQQVTFAAIPSRRAGGEPVTLSAESDAGQAISFKVVKGEDLVKLEGKILTPLKAGIATIEANAAANQYYHAGKASRDFVITDPDKKDQKITITTTVPDKVTIEEEVPFAATADSDLPVEIKVEGEAAFKDGKLSFNKAGSVVVKVSQNGDDTYNPAEPVVVTIEVTKIPQTISWQQAPTAGRVGDTLQLEAVASSNLAVQYRLLKGGALLNDGQLILLSPGEVRVEAYQRGSDRYESVYAHLSITVKEKTTEPEEPEEPTDPDKRTQQLAYYLPENISYGIEPFALQATVNSNLPLNISITGPASYSAGIVTIQGAGSVAIRLQQAGNETYLPLDTTISFTVAKAAQQISFEITPLSESEFLLQGQSTSGLPINFQVEKGTAVIRGDTLIVQASGVMEVGAYQQGNENYLPAEPVKRSIEVELITGINDDVSAKIKVYPNPTDEELYVLLSGRWTDSEYMLLDEKGALVEQGKVKRTGIDMRSRSAGVYLLKVKQGEEWFSYKVVKK